jgi:hypothetical protein
MTYLLLFFYCVTLCPSIVLCSPKTIDIPTEQTEVLENFTEKNAVVSDTFAVEKAIAEIRNFYAAYTAVLLSDNSSPDSLMKKYLTKRLIEKTGRMRTATGADPVIRAQDFTESARNTLDINYLNENWFMVGYSYSWHGGKDTLHTNIPLRVTQADGRYLIDYITPIWNGSLYGDSLLFDHPVPQTIDASAPLPFLKTFYAAYTMEYCNMPEYLMPRLVALQKKYLTPNALVQFEAAANEYSLDGSIGYDLLIDYFDFDRLWLPSVKFTLLDNEDTCQMCYMRGETLCTIKLQVTRQGKQYQIDSVIKEL